MQVKYIYNPAGQLESAIIPYKIWDSIQKYLPKKLSKPKQIKIEFDPTEFIGMLSHYNFDIETELKEMRAEW